MFSKVLVANRGEIAVRVIRACRELGIATVAVYSEIDHDAMHVRLADEAYGLGGTTAAGSYLNTEAVIAAVKRSGAEAVHPGYGFLSENAEFARAVTASGAVFVGPPPEAITTMADKLSARRAAARVGVNGVPGTAEPISEASQVTAFGEEHGWPVAVKATHGGGGRGMRIVAETDDPEAAVESARREAEAYFRQDELYVERYLRSPRHVEVQVLADSHGTCVYLGTRDCTAQRRHQKLVEEAPAPGIDAEAVSAVGADAVRVAVGCGYVNAGTVEFLYSDGDFYYLEMNTRLQVEHPVTEAVTGIDLVEQQLRIAAGMPLEFAQEDVSISGHAIEVRVNAEDPAGGAFTPCPGRIQRLRPAQGFGVRWDGGYESGDEVSQYYDNLIGKLVVWGRDRATAIARTRRALTEMTVTGVVTTTGAVDAIVGHPDFAAVEHSTKWVEEQLDLGGLPQPDGYGTLQAPKGSAPDAADHKARVRREVVAEVDGKRFSVAMWVPDQPSTAGDGAAGPSSAMRRRRRGPASAGGSGDVTVAMQGTIVRLLVKPGENVEAGQPVAVLEAMKMENNVTAGRAGVISEIRVSVGDSVGGGDVVAVIG